MNPSWILPDAWNALKAPIQGTLPRTRSKYFAVVQQFEVETALRYQKRPSPKDPRKWWTYCNIFCLDVVKAMGCEIPRIINPATGQPKLLSEGGEEMTANKMVRWLRMELQQWRSVPQDVAEIRASLGYPTIMAWENHEGPGHVVMVLGKNLIAQAGGVNFFGQSIRNGFGQLDRIEASTFHTHD